MTSDSDGAVPASAEDFLRFEARLNARLGELMARLVLHDGRFVALTDRLNQHDRRADATSARVDAHFDAVDARFNRVDARHDLLNAKITDWYENSTAELKHHIHAHRRTTLIGFAVTTTINTLMCLATILITR